MSSAKDFILELQPSIDASNFDSIGALDQLTFTVKSKQPPILYRAKLPLLLTLITATTTYIAYTKPNLHDHLVQFMLSAILTMSTLLVGLAQEPQDSLMIMKGMGAQLTVRKMFPFQNSSKFIPINNMIDLVIHEGFHGYGQIIFYLCFLTKGKEVKKSEDTIRVVFAEFLPRKEILLSVWKVSRLMLFGENRRYWRRVPGQGLRQVN
ncbi:uncharacterized protein LODBEIA_P09080 [Lodderomyces beijingensis]|uniref:Phosphatidylinositol N-acetylglucosaminyltransferase subunit H conserved domain-containing protein n=1 Tax=Lodderomyces beijingensis TaxID=1775926 RepID=A0ABP0ZEV3_9ASCO